jgi:hypothetical protein
MLMRMSIWSHDRRRSRRATRPLISLILLASATSNIATLAGCVTPTASSATGGGVATTSQPSFALSTSAPRSLTSVDTSSIPAPAAAATSPTDAAERWLIAYRTISWIDGSPNAWIGRVRPYVTGALDVQDRQYADAGGGADWQNFVTKQCSSTVTNVDAVIPVESPGTAIEVNVQVTGTVNTVCDAGQPDNPVETASATLVVTQVSDGLWRVDQRLY